MKTVPLNRLLIQPTVQCKWLEQHKTIEFILEPKLQHQFSNLWQTFLESQPASMVSFLDSDVGRKFELHDNDLLFALLAGADFILQKYPQFETKFLQPNLLWTIE